MSKQAQIYSYASNSKPSLYTRKQLSQNLAKKVVAWNKGR